jgi:predicted permease
MGESHPVRHGLAAGTGLANQSRDRSSRSLVYPSCSIATAVLFGLAPALRATRVDLVPGLKENWASPPDPSQPRLHSRKVLVVVETALSLVLLAGAGLFVRTLANLESQDLGFHSDRVLLFGLDPSQQDYKGQRAVHFYEDLLVRLRALPAVESASLSSHVLLSGSGAFFNGFTAEGRAANPHSNGVHLNWVSPGFLQTMRIPLLAGRNFEPQDNSASQPVALISQTMATQFFGDEDPLGRWLQHGDLPSKVTVVGVVKDAKYSSADEDDLADLYLPYLQQRRDLGGMNVEIRTHVDPLSLIPQVRELVAQIDRNIPISDIRTQDEQVSESLLQQRLFARLSSFFGFLALLLVWVGLYGLVAYAAAQRTHEIGIRIALGAPREEILKLVLGQGLKVTLIGVGIGVVVAFVLTRFISSLLYGVKPADPVTFGAVSLILTTVALLASYLPAHRAAKVDPTVALRYE